MSSGNGSPGMAAPAGSGGSAGAVPLVITVHGVPAPQGSKKGYIRGGRVSMVESSAKVKPWREAVKWAALDAIDHREGLDGLRIPLAEPVMLGPVTVSVTFTLARPKSHYRTGRNAHLLRDEAPARSCSKPDLDKLLRSTFDALGEASVWRDDSQVAFVVAAKVYGPTPGAHITVEASS